MKNIIIILHIVTATIYHAVPGQTDDTPDITASGFVINLERPMSHRIIAVSRDLEKLGFTMGTKVCVTNAGKMNGVWTIEDRMNKRFTDRIDFLVDTKMKLGKWNDVKMEKIN